ncbi:MAG: 2-hydroxyacyl-CoA dehydratase family protein [Clostridiales bacterium]|nr:2-hydroxyacyl-CoA dehydratase family protein [Clostridiales bacterium]
MIKDILEKFHAAASDPSAQKDKYLNEGKKIVLVSYYTPEEIIHSMGAVPFGVWGGDLQLQESKQYFPAFICSIVQSIVELGMNGTYKGASAIVFTSLCDSLKVVGENWKYAVPSIKFIPMTYPQNRKPDFGHDFTKAGYERVIKDVAEATGLSFDEEKLAASIEIYNEHNQVMRALVPALAEHPEITNAQRSDIFKSAFFMLKEEHTALVKELLAALKEESAAGNAGVGKKIRIMTTGILCDAPDLLQILDENGMQIVCDDVAAESRQYRVDAPAEGSPMDRLVEKFCSMDNDTLLYDADKKRVEKIVEDAKQADAKGVLAVMTKFCDPEEFDYPLIRKACQAADLPILNIEVDRQMVDYGQARTAIETFKDIL